MLDLARNLRVDSVARLEPTPALLVDVTDPISKAVGLMCAQQVGCVLVCDRDLLMGIFTERDLLARVLVQRGAAAAGDPHRHDRPTDHGTAG
jgi:CBS domain-containing protein